MCLASAMVQYQTTGYCHEPLARLGGPGFSSLTSHACNFQPAREERRRETRLKIEKKRPVIFFGPREFFIEIEGIKNGTYLFYVKYGCGSSTS